MKKKLLNKLINFTYAFLSGIFMLKERFAIYRFYSNGKFDFQYQSKRISHICRLAKKNTVYYQDKISECDSLLDFPILDKDDFRIIGEINLISKYHFIKPKYKMNTGGSTGQPYEFYADLRAGIIDSIHQKAQHIKAGYKKNDLIYVFNGCDIPSNLVSKNIFWKVKNKRQLPFGSKEFSSHYLNEKNIRYYLSELIRIPPQFIRTYPSVFYEFTMLLISLDYKKPPFQLKGIQLTSEVITPEQDELIKNFWGDIIYYQYGHSEVAVIASKFPGDDCYSFSPIYGFVEILDENDKQVASNEVGRIVVTSLHNTVRPFIRYDTGDLAIFKRVYNGVVEAYNIIGRNQDYVVDRFNNKVSITGLVFGQHFHAFKNILSWQIENINPGCLIVNIVKMPSFSEVDYYELISKLSFDGSFDVKINFVNEIMKTSRGKHRLVING